MANPLHAAHRSKGAQPARQSTDRYLNYALMGEYLILLFVVNIIIIKIAPKDCGGTEKPL